MRSLLTAVALAALTSCVRNQPPEVTSLNAGMQAPTGPYDAGPAPTLGPMSPDVTADFPSPPPPQDLSSRYSKQIYFRGGSPLLSVGLAEGREEVVFLATGRLRVFGNNGPAYAVEPGGSSQWTVRLRDGKPAELSVRILIKEFTFADKTGLAVEQERWRRRGLKVRVQTLGSVFGIAGKVIDNRRNYLLLEDPVQPQEAQQRQEQLRRRYRAETTLFEELKGFPSGTVELLDTAGRLIAQSQDRLVMEVAEGDVFTVRLVEFGIGYDFHGFEDRSYRGSLEFIVDRNGKLAVVNLLSLEDLLKGLVPAEIFASAPMEALKAQAVTARGEVLAKIGTKHLADPYVLCAEQHCAVYRGTSAESAETNAAVDATRGVALFSSDGRLVDSVYSAVCGGHTENNEVAWNTPPNPNLRGKPDFLHPSNATPQELAAYLSADLPAACRLTSFSQPSKFRWERRFTAQEMDQLTAALGVGSIHSISVIERGVSGRARSISLVGERGNARIQGELNIRRTFGMLNSSMFIVTPERAANGKVTGWVFRGGGWGHGVGMCQTGAIGRAEAGQDYATILRHYFSGAEPVRIY